MTFDLLTAARDLIAIDSRSQRSTRPVVELLAPLCRAAGLHVAFQEETHEGIPQYNIIASRGALREDSLLLATHVDTVPPGEHALWNKTGGDPFALTVHGQYLYGLGVADVKLDFLCKLAALHRLRDTPLERGVALAGTYGEETGRFGARLLVDALRPLPRTILVGEPSELRPVGGHKGYVEFRTTASTPRPEPAPDLPCWRITFPGVSAHSSQTHRGSSANDACLDAVIGLLGARTAVLAVTGGDAANKVAAECQALVAAAAKPAVAGAIVQPESPTGRQYWSPALVRLLLELHQATVTLRRELSRTRMQSYDPPYSTVNNGIVRLTAGALHYVVDARRLPDELSAQALDDYAVALQRLATVHPDLSVTTERVLDAPPHTPRPGSPLLQIVDAVLQSRGRNPDRAFKSGTTEAPVYQEAGMDALVLGPGAAAGNIHRPNERMPLSELFEAIEIYTDVILRFCA